jgi:hypothetical protein
MSELLNPNRQNLQQVFADQFEGVTLDPLPLTALEVAREQLIEQINRDLTNAEREFLLSMKQLAPRWNLLGIPGLERLPGLQWKFHVKNGQKTDRWIFGRFSHFFPKKTPINADFVQCPLGFAVDKTFRVKRNLPAKIEASCKPGNEAITRLYHLYRRFRRSPAESGRGRLWNKLDVAMLATGVGDRAWSIGQSLLP